ncbi:hypothetical protein [Nocardioides sp.]|uniref:hypothetical protein n=1 Tax=Nocardioides sp. TaxID=35761 RepID=UPI0026020732|nr:hypothetical protein [Nocardioides sp.]
MSSLGRLSKINLLAAIRDYPKDPEALSERYEELGLDAEAADLMVVERGKQYDARVLVVAAYRKLTGDLLSEDELPADLRTVLTRLELTVMSLREAIAADTLKSARSRVPGSARPTRATARPTPAVPETPAPAVCPRCFMQLPAGSKACDYCD